MEEELPLSEFSEPACVPMRDRRAEALGQQVVVDQQITLSRVL